MEKLDLLRREIKGKVIKLHELDKSKTALVVVDMVNGFVYEGALASPRVAEIAKEIERLNERTSGFKKVFFIDEHSEKSAEFKSYPKHCVKGTNESELIDELKNEHTYEENSTMIPKNSTNGFHAPNFQMWLKENEESIDNYIVTGCVTDICVLQFCLTLNSYFNEHDMKKRIIVPLNAVETYTGGSHDGDLMNLFSLYNMKINGIEVVDKID